MPRKALCTGEKRIVFTVVFSAGWENTSGMKALLLSLGVLVLLNSLEPAQASERSAVRNLQSSLLRISEEPRLNHPSEANAVLDQKLSQLRSVDGQMSSLLEVLVNPGLRQAVGSAQNILRRASNTPANDPATTMIYLGEVVKIAGQAAATLDVKADQSSSCTEDVLRNPLGGDTI